MVGTRKLEKLFSKRGQILFFKHHNQGIRREQGLALREHRKGSLGFLAGVREATFEKCIFTADMRAGVRGERPPVITGRSEGGWDALCVRTLTYIYLPGLRPFCSIRR